MGIHYDYKSKKGERAMQKQAKRDERLALRKEKKRIKKSSNNSKKEKAMHDILKPITLEDLTNPNKDK